VLYTIDAAMYRATFQGATADLASAKAALESATLKDDRYANLVKIEGVSKQEADDAHAAHNQAIAGVAQKQAALEMARINLEYTSIRAPIAGRIGKSSITAGALVTANQPEPLATIRSLDPIYVDMTDSIEDLMKHKAGAKDGKAKVTLVLGDGSTYGREGALEFSEVAVDEATGMVTLRAKFENPDELLLPGMYVRAKLDRAIDQQAILAPQQGITRDPKGDAMAMVVGADGKAEPRPVVADRAIGDRWLVTKGLKAGDKLIVEGLNKIGPGMPVHATEVNLAAPPPAPPAGK
jgi:membrane fusion protein (multidrug efflux system)